jgi:heterodisulfide reductase subunit D
MTTLEELRRVNARCIHCRACQYAYSGEPDKEGETEEYTGMLQGCPAGLYFGWEGYFNSGKQWMARAFLNGELPASKELLEVAEACTTCAMCETQCPNYIETVHITEALRAAIIEAGVEPLDKHKGFGVRVNNDELRNPYNEPREERTKWFSGVVDNKDAKIAYFVGCTAAYRQQQIATHTESILNKLGLEYTVLSDEVCCGSPILRTGQRDVFNMVMKENMEMFKNFDLVLFSCAGCYKTFRNDYPHMSGEELPFKVRQKAKQAHYELPRVVLNSIPGLELKEMYRIKGDSFCCGAGGGVKAQFPDMAMFAAKERMKEAASTGADEIMTSCPFCVTNFNDAVKALKQEEEETGKDLSDQGSKMKVVELLEVLDELL